MTTATSPRYQSGRAPPSRTASSRAQEMPPFFSSPRVSTPLQSTQANAKTPSPNYFGFQSNERSAFLTDSPHHAKQNWSPPSSAVRSTAAASPSIVPLDQNPEFDAFRRQSEGKGAFNLGGLNGNFKMNAPPPSRKQNSSAGKSTAEKDGLRTQPRDMPPPHRPRGSISKAMDSLDPASAELSRSPKRMLSPGSATREEPPRKASPAHFAHDIERPQSQPRVKLPLDHPAGLQSFSKANRADTLPATTPSEAESQMVTPQHVMTLVQPQSEDMLILDLRVSTQYAKSHVAGALNLCIPTTLLKRPSFGVQKLAETFKDDEQRRKFENWRNSSYIIVYDMSSAQLKDAQICVNMVKKFQSEGYEGTLHIMKGGFAEFSKSFSQYTESGSEPSSSQQQQQQSGNDGPEIAPVIGGCPMPSTDKPANPFFGNIRQNMDLIGGVGQMPLKHPNAHKTTEEQFPKWLRKAADDRDQGKKVSTKFEAIERREKKRMEDALSGKVSYGAAPTPKSPRPKPERKGTDVQIAGIEKGNKNRYNNIWPFEHSRVKLQGVPKTGCDYFNANHIQAAWSNKRYISTQAPIPATFNDFWNVIWQQDVRVIVMLTAEKEGAQVKAHNYWDSNHYGPLHLDFLSEKRASIEPSRIHNAQKKRPSTIKRASTHSANPQIPLATMDAKDARNEDQPYVIVRKFTLKHERYPFEPMREITQLQYSSWPDFGAPAHPTHLLGLVEQTDAVVRATNKTHGSKDPEPAGERPILVHCSAGCGRTGTFCTVDSVIDMLKRQRISQEKKHHPRDTSPMDIDERTPARSPGPRLSKEDSEHRKRSGGDGDFFGALLQPEAHDGEGVDGKWVESEEVDLVEKCVEDFRHQRLSMVQSLRQFVLCYESVMEWLADQSPLDGDKKSSPRY